MVWPTLGSRTAKEQNRTTVYNRFYRYFENNRMSSFCTHPLEMQYIGLLSSYSNSIVT